MLKTWNAVRRGGTLGALDNEHACDRHIATPCLLTALPEERTVPQEDPRVTVAKGRGTGQEETLGGRRKCSVS